MSEGRKQIFDPFCRSLLEIRGWESGKGKSLIILVFLDIKTAHPNPISRIASPD